MRLPEDVSAAMDRLERAGFAAYAVGGCVRDAELGLAPHDWDVCTAATPAEMQRVFAGERTIETGLRHGMTAILVMTGETTEEMLARSETKPDLKYGRLADMIPELK